MANLPVKYYTSNMEGAPQLSNAYGVLVDMLDACLVNGFNSKPVASLTFADGIATANITAGHLYEVGQVIAIEGAAQAEYNGEARLLTTNATQFTFAVSGTPASPATGTITAKVAPLGFEKVFAATHKGVYRSKNVLSNRPYLRVDNAQDPLYNAAYAKKGKVSMHEGMSDINTTVGAQAPFNPSLPSQGYTTTGSGTSVVDGWYKWYYARAEVSGAAGYDTVAPVAKDRSWVLVGDDRGFYFFTEWNGTYGATARATYCFTDFESFRQGDAFNTLLGATEFNATAITGISAGADHGCFFPRSLQYEGKILMKDHLQVGGTTRVGLFALQTLNSQQISGQNTGVPWPNGPDYSLLLHPAYLMQETTGHVRGKLPGLMWVHNNQPLTDLAVLENVTGYPGRKFLLVACASATSGPVARFAFDITGPWY